MGISASGQGSNSDQRRKARNLAKRELWGGTDPKLVETIGELMAALTGEGIAVRLLPCGIEQPEFSLGGLLIDRSDYIQPEREALYSRFGSLLGGWTAVVQVDTVPLDQPGASPDLSDVQLVNDGMQIDRGSAERMAIDLMTFMDQIGVSEGPRWPAISVTPLAIFRPIPSAP